MRIAAPGVSPLRVNPADGAGPDGHGPSPSRSRGSPRHTGNGRRGRRGPTSRPQAGRPHARRDPACGRNCAVMLVVLMAALWLLVGALVAVVLGRSLGGADARRPEKAW